MKMYKTEQNTILALFFKLQMPNELPLTNYNETSNQLFPVTTNNKWIKFQWKQNCELFIGIINAVFNLKRW